MFFKYNLKLSLIIGIHFEETQYLQSNEYFFIKYQNYEANYKFFELNKTKK